MCLAVVVWGVLCMGAGMCVRVRAHLVPSLYGDPTSLRADNCIHTHTKSNLGEKGNI